MADGEEVWRWRLLRDLGELRNRDDEEFWEDFLWSGPENAGGIDEKAYDQALDSACAAARRSQAIIRKDLAKRERALEMLFNPKLRYSSYRGLPLATVYLGFSYNERHRSASQMLHFADKARFEAELARPTDHLPGVVFDLRARVLTELANAYRVNDRFVDAEKALGKAQEYLRKGSGDLSLVALCREVEASLRREQRRLPEAFALLDEAYRLYQEIGDTQFAGRVLVNRAYVAQTGGDPAEAVRILDIAVALLDPTRDAALWDNCTQALLSNLVDCSQFARASAILSESGLREKFADQPLNYLRLLWVEAKVHAGLEQLTEAEALFSEVRQGFLRNLLEYDAALAGLDLAAVWLRQGRASWVLPLAIDMCKTFDQMNLETPEASRAAMFLVIACRLQVADLALLQRIRAFLSRYQGDRSLRFDPEAIVEG